MKSVYFCVYLSKKSYPVVAAATGFSLSGGFNSDILPWNPCTATACKFPAKNTRNFFEVLLTLFEPPVEFNADITRPAFGTHPAAVLASVLPLSADR